VALAVLVLSLYSHFYVTPAHKAQVMLVAEGAQRAGYSAALKDQADALRLDKPGQYRVIFSGVARIMSDDARVTPTVQALVVDAVPDTSLNPPRYKNPRLVTVPLVQTSGWGVGASHLAFERRTVLGKVVETYRFWSAPVDPNGPLVTTAFGQDLDLSFMAERIGDQVEPELPKPVAKSKSSVTTPAKPSTVSTNR